jgi:hypothetical protein
MQTWADATAALGSVRYAPGVHSVAKRMVIYLLA